MAIDSAAMDILREWTASQALEIQAIHRELQAMNEKIDGLPDKMVSQKDCTDCRKSFKRQAAVVGGVFAGLGVIVGFTGAVMEFLTRVTIR